MPDYEGRLDELFERVLEQPDDQRESFIHRMCSDDTELESALRELLANDEAPEDDLFEHSPASRFAPPPAPSLEYVPTDRIGQYRIVREIGRGGMGVVYLAEQEHPRRSVAVKVLRTGHLNWSLVARFRREAQALAQLQHRGIAHIYESGSARIGNEDLPFLAMEFIDGLPLDQYVRSHTLSVRQRLELIARVCDAVQHAHQKGVIHRDLKPSNVLVVAESSTTGGRHESSLLVDEIGEPKILDFGIARFTDADVGTTLHTHTGQIVGTLAYMSPEQVDGRPEDVDTRSDVYALGVMLYAILAGRPPHDMGGMPLTEAARIIKEDEPAPLSLLDASLRGDVTTIVAKAMRKDRELRYESAGLMAEDIRRSLRDEPISARPASTSYHLRKFARRNKALVGGVTASLVLLMAGIVGTSIGLALALRSNTDLTVANTELKRVNEEILVANENVLRANSNVKQAVDLQNALFLEMQVATIAASIREELLADVPDDQKEELGELLEDVNFVNIARATLSRTLYFPAIEQIRTQMAGQPRILASLMRGMAHRLYRMGYADEASDLILESLGLCREVYEPEHQETRTCLIMAGTFLQRAGRSERAEELLLEARQIADRLDPPDVLFEECVHRTLGIVYDETDRFAEARQCYEGALDAYRRESHGGEANAAFVMTMLGRLYFREGDPVRGEAQLRDALAFGSEKLGEKGFMTIGISLELGRSLCEIGRHAEGIPILRTGLADARRVTSDEHRRTLNARLYLATALIETGEFAEAQDHLIEFERVSSRHSADYLGEAATAARAFVKLYDAWHEAEPDAGHDASAALWRERLELATTDSDGE